MGIMSVGAGNSDIGLSGLSGQTAVEIDDHTIYEPDAFRQSTPLPDDAVKLNDPIVGLCCRHQAKAATRALA
jgi:hypothetical protein